jgi:adenine deaminase
MATKKKSIKSNLVDVVNRQIFPAELVFSEDKIHSINKLDERLDSYLLPGFIDAHVHIESSMLVPTEFARLAVVHGTVCTVSDPHEIGNVLGISGVRFMIENGKKSPFKFHFGAPSCVPATVFETAGAEITPAEIEELFDSGEVKYLSEMMNWPGVLQRNQQVMDKINLTLKRGLPVDGHAPGLRGKQAKNYIKAGISTDHECFTAEEAMDKLRAGMKIAIREGSAAKNFDALSPLIDEYYDQLMFCSDDKHPDDLVEGHINQLVVRAVKNGHDFFKVLQIACVNPVKHYKLDVGLLQKGDRADFIEVKNLQHFEILNTYINGVPVSKNGKSLLPHVTTTTPNKFRTRAKQPVDFKIKPEKENIRIIEVFDGQLVTGEFIGRVREKKGNAISDPEKDILKIAVVNRYENEPPAIGFIKNFGLKRGAIASSVAHDSHNILAVGADDDSIARAVNLIIDKKGGVSAVSGEESMMLPLPVAGLMSDKDGYKVAREYSKIDHFSKASLGATLQSPFMSLSFMALLVIPSLKLSDQGLFDGNQFKFISLFTKKKTMEKSGKAENFLKDLGKKIDELIEDSKDSSSELRKEIDERVEELQKSASHLKDEFVEFAEENKDSVDEMKDRLGEFGKDLKHSFEKLFKRAEDEGESADENK